MKKPLGKDEKLKKYAKYHSVSVFTADQIALSAEADKKETTIANLVSDLLKGATASQLHKKDVERITAGAEKLGVPFADFVSQLIDSVDKVGEILSEKNKVLLENADVLNNFLSAAGTADLSPKDYYEKLTDGIQLENLILVAKDKETIEAVTAAIKQMTEGGITGITDDKFLTNLSNYYIE